MVVRAGVWRGCIYDWKVLVHVLRWEIWDRVSWVWGLICCPFPGIKKLWHQLVARKGCGCCCCGNLGGLSPSTQKCKVCPFAEFFSLLINPPLPPSIYVFLVKRIWSFVMFQFSWVSCRYGFLKGLSKTVLFLITWANQLPDIERTSHPATRLGFMHQHKSVHKLKVP
jgi:hypothetical protein